MAVTDNYTELPEFMAKVYYINPSNQAEECIPCSIPLEYSDFIRAFQMSTPDYGKNWQSVGNEVAFQVNVYREHVSNKSGEFINQ